MRTILLKLFDEILLDSLCLKQPLHCHSKVIHISIFCTIKTSHYLFSILYRNGRSSSHLLIVDILISSFYIVTISNQCHKILTVLKYLFPPQTSSSVKILCPTNISHRCIQLTWLFKKKT